MKPQKAPPPPLVRIVGLAAGVLLLVSAMDAIVAGFRTPDEEVRLVAGSRAPVAGKTETAIPGINWLTYESSGPHVTLVFLEGRGRLWRGRVEASPDAPAGEVSLRVFLHGETPEEAERNPVYRVRIFEDVNALQKAERSFFRRLLGWSPWIVAATALPVLMACLGLSYRAETRRDQALRRQGVAPVYRARKGADGWELAFGLGTADGLHAGDRVMVVDGAGKTIGTAVVTSTTRDDALARLDSRLSLPRQVFVAARGREDPSGKA